MPKTELRTRYVLSETEAAALFVLDKDERLVHVFLNPHNGDLAIETTREPADARG